MWFAMYYIIYFKYRSDPNFKNARSPVYFIKAQPWRGFSLFSVYRYIEFSIYGLLILASSVLALEYGMWWLGK
jgi:hypothetical protein